MSAAVVGLLVVVCVLLLAAVVDRADALRTAKRNAAQDIAAWDEALTLTEQANAALVDELAAVRRAYDRSQDDLRIATWRYEREAFERPTRRRLTNPDQAHGPVGAELRRWADLINPALTPDQAAWLAALQQDLREL